MEVMAAQLMYCSVVYKYYSPVYTPAAARVKAVAVQVMKTVEQCYPG